MPRLPRSPGARRCPVTGRPRLRARHQRTTTDASLRRVNLDGTNLETIVTGTAPSYIELDYAAGQIYFAHGGSGATQVSRANLDGTNTQIILTTSTDIVRGIALNVVSGSIYVGLVGQFDGSYTISRADLDGGNLTDFLTDLPELPHDLAIDPNARQLYWSFSEGVHRINLDLTGGIETIVSGP